MEDRVQPFSEDAKLEHDLASRTPYEYQEDPAIGQATEDSIAWAEKKIGAKLPEPDLDLKWEKIRANEKESYDYDEDKDITSTLKSAKWAEDAYNLTRWYNGYGNYRYGGYGYGGYGNNTYGANRFGNDTGGNNTYGYGNYGYGYNYQREKNDSDWWNYLAKDQFDGMHALQREKEHWELDNEKISKGDLGDRMEEYNKMQGVKHAQNKMTDEDRGHARDIKNQLFRYYNPYGYGDFKQEGENVKPRRKF